MKNVLRRYFDRAQTLADQNAQERKTNESECRYYKLPYIGKLSSEIKTKLSKLSNIVGKYCKQGTEVRLIFTSNEIGSYFRLKDSFPREMLSKIVYKFVFAGCNDCYIGETTKRYIDRAREHLYTDRKSSVYKHIPTYLPTGSTSVGHL